MVYLRTLSLGFCVVGLLLVLVARWESGRDPFVFGFHTMLAILLFYVAAMILGLGIAGWLVWLLGWYGAFA